MSDRIAHVDVSSLQDFQSRLVGPLLEVDYALANMYMVLSRGPSLGTFADGTGTTQQYLRLHREYLDRLNRLRKAILAVGEATGTIIKNYATTEALNQTSADDIAEALNSLDVVLTDEDIR